MAFVLVIVAAREGTLSAPSLARCERLLDGGHIRFSSPRWLSPHKAAEIPLEDSLPLPMLRVFQNVLGEEQMDVFQVSLTARRKKLLLADMDSTIITTETLDELAEYAGLKDRISEITRRAMAGEINFHMALNARVSLLAGLPVHALDQTLSKATLTEGAETLVRVMRWAGAKTILVSGGFTFFTKDVARRCGFDFHHGNHLEITDGQLTGRVVPPVLDKEAKLFFLRKYSIDMGIDVRETLAIGDGANDLPMLEHAGLGIGYRPKPVVRESVPGVILYTDLTSALYVQGYTGDDIHQALEESRAP